MFFNIDKSNKRPTDVLLILCYILCYISIIVGIIYLILWRIKYLPRRALNIAAILSSILFIIHKTIHYLYITHKKKSVSRGVIEILTAKLLYLFKILLVSGIIGYIIWIISNKDGLLIDYILLGFCSVFFAVFATIVWRFYFRFIL